MEVHRLRRNYKKELGATQAELVQFYHFMGMNYDEIQEFTKAPRASIRGRVSEILNTDNPRKYFAR